MTGFFQWLRRGRRPSQDHDTKKATTKSGKAIADKIHRGERLTPEELERIKPWLEDHGISAAELPELSANLREQESELEGYRARLATIGIELDRMGMTEGGPPFSQEVLQSMYGALRREIQENLQSPLAKNAYLSAFKFWERASVRMHGLGHGFRTGRLDKIMRLPPRDELNRIIVRLDAADDNTPLMPLLGLVYRTMSPSDTKIELLTKDLQQAITLVSGAYVQVFRAAGLEPLELAGEKNLTSRRMSALKAEVKSRGRENVALVTGRGNRLHFEILSRNDPELAKTFWTSNVIVEDESNASSFVKSFRS